MNIIEKLTLPSEKFDDPKVWKLIGEGNTSGLWQIESGLLKSYSKKLRPKKIEDLSALVAIVRPGTLESLDEATQENMCAVFCKRANNELPVEYLHPTLEKHLKETYGVLVYQEQAMSIVQDIAGFNLQQADELRKAAGKKIPEEMAKVKIKFLDGCKKEKKVDEEAMDKIWQWIEKSQRYSFNKSHSQSYAVLTYISAYLKAYDPSNFYISWLRHSDGKSNRFDEVQKLASDAKVNGFDVLLPSLQRLNKTFQMENGSIAFGLSNIRGISEKSFSDLELTFKGKVPIIWTDFVLTALTEVDYGVVKGLINSGALDYLKVPRNQMFYEYENYREFLTDKDIDYVKGFIGWGELREKKWSILDSLKILKEGSKVNNRKIIQKKLEKIRSLVSIIENPPYSLNDSIDFLSVIEDNYLGIAVSCSRIDDKQIGNANCSVLDLVKGNVGDYVCVGSVVERVNPYTVKKGKNKGSEMAFITISDNTGHFESCVCFNEAFKDYKEVLTEKNTVLLRGKYQKEKKSFIIEKAWQV